MSTTPATEIPNRFDFETAQPRIWQLWLDSGLFHAEPDPSRKPYTIVIPPPNVTGALHLGHALNNSLQDTLIRFKRMQGYNALYMPGTDHAGIATQAVVERRLKEEEKLTRHDLGREKLVERIWQWKNEYEARILGQLKRLGCSCDWERTRFTLDDICARAVRHTFFDLFRQTKIYRGKRLVNWDTYLQTAVSDDEVSNETVKGHFWHLRYPIINPAAGEPAHVVVATTRPETMLGDTAVAVHPDPAGALDKAEADLNERLAKSVASERGGLAAQIEAIQTRRSEVLPALLQLAAMAKAGRKIRLPLLHREIPLVLDTWAKPELGSGCVKITPAHDPNDYEVAKRCQLPLINILNPDGTLNAEAGPYVGLPLKQARQKIVADLEAQELLERVEEREIELPMSDRSKTPIEPYLADQWFVRMAELAESAMEAVRDGRVKITPDRYAKGYLDWLGEKRDWPVSRQLWWGHQIPVWSQPAATSAEAEDLATEVRALTAFDSRRFAIHIEHSEETDVAKRERLGLPFATVHVCVRDENDPLEPQIEELGFVRESDVLDTWFSSALWPHSTLGWPESTPELQYFYPTSTLVTSRDIITLWVARMVLMGLNNIGQIPFDQVFVHPKILDGFGETMSKSKGNGIDPIDVIDKVGADPLRFAMVHLTTETQDVRLPVQFECPHCQAAIEQTKKNRELPAIECPSCKQKFSTQWARTAEDRALPKGPVLSERFEVARNFMNKLWNASRFAMMRLDGFTPGPVDTANLHVEDRWILSRLATTIAAVTNGLDRFAFAEVARTLYDFTWSDFCSFYVEILKERFADESARPQAQRMLAFVLDNILRLLHPIMPFITEDIWQHLRGFASHRGLEQPEPASEYLLNAPWPQLSAAWQNPEIEAQFALFQDALGALREIRARQNIAPKKEIACVIRCDQQTAERLRPLAIYFGQLANATLGDLGPAVSTPQLGAQVAVGAAEVHVDLTGLINVEAELKRLEKEKVRIEGSLAGKEKMLSNEKYVAAKPEEAEKIREQLAQLREQLTAVAGSLETLAKMPRS
ncbi:MAG: valine--tRNA ligase [Planctomycetota bacterium]